MSEPVPPSVPPIPLPERFVLGELAGLKRTVEERRAARAPVTFDGEGVCVVDSAALQFLLVCHATRDPADGAPVLVEAGATLGPALADIGVIDLSE